MSSVRKAVTLSLVIASCTYACHLITCIVPCYAQAGQPAELRPVNPEFRGEPGCPVEVITARTDMEIDPFGTPLAARHYIDYRNTSNKQVAAVKFRIGYVGADGKIQLPYLNAPDGHPLDPGGQAGQKWRGEKVPGNTVSVKIRVLQVKFSDGTTWESEKLRESNQSGAGGDGGGFLPLTAEGDRTPGAAVQFGNYGAEQYKTVPDQTASGPVPFTPPRNASATPYGGGNSPLLTSPGGVYGNGTGAPSAVPGASPYGNKAVNDSAPSSGGHGDSGFGGPPATSAPASAAPASTAGATAASSLPPSVAAPVSAAPVTAPAVPVYTAQPVSKPPVVESTNPIADFDAILGPPTKRSPLRPAAPASPASVPGSASAPSASSVPATSAPASASQAVPTTTVAPSVAPAASATPDPAPAPVPVAPTPEATTPAIAPAVSPTSVNSAPAVDNATAQSAPADSPAATGTQAKPAAGDEFSGQ